uniref:Beta-glucosidase (EC) n=1 Tax=Ganoderma boninense TaxID=34458 RepID=A0A5K1JZR0_9APHY|nr:Beta-glucosidase (EC [Ganoderma boninense]
MGFYFRVDRVLYGVTARHILFPANEGNDSYTYIAGPKKEVVLMGRRAFTDFLTSVQHRIEVLNQVVTSLESQARTITERLESSGAEQVSQELAKTEGLLRDTHVEIKEVQEFLKDIRNRWTKPNDRVIGRVVWAPSISASTSASTPQDGYMQDVCVIKLDKNKFRRTSTGTCLT